MEYQNCYLREMEYQKTAKSRKIVCGERLQTVSSSAAYGELIPPRPDSSQKHAYIILTPLNSTLCSKTGVYRGTHYFLISAQKHRFGNLLEWPRRGRSNEYHNLCFEQEYENYQNFSSDSFQFLMVKFSIYLNRHIFRNVRSEMQSDR